MIKNLLLLAVVEMGLICAQMALVLLNALLLTIIYHRVFCSAKAGDAEMQREFRKLPMPLPSSLNVLADEQQSNNNAELDENENNKKGDSTA